MLPTTSASTEASGTTLVSSAWTRASHHALSVLTRVAPCCYASPAASHPPGTQRGIWDWDSSVYLGTIDEAPQTYNVIGNMNEKQLTIGS
jgi:hypothetical protein